jgi:hypothetical protein
LRHKFPRKEKALLSQNILIYALTTALVIGGTFLLYGIWRHAKNKGWPLALFDGAFFICTILLIFFIMNLREDVWGFAIPIFIIAVLLIRKMIFGELVAVNMTIIKGKEAHNELYIRPKEKNFQSVFVREGSARRSATAYILSISGILFFFLSYNSLDICGMQENCHIWMAYVSMGFSALLGWAGILSLIKNYRYGYRIDPHNKTLSFWCEPHIADPEIHHFSNIEKIIFEKSMDGENDRLFLIEKSGRKTELDTIVFSNERVFIEELLSHAPDIEIEICK